MLYQLLRQPKQNHPTNNYLMLATGLRMWTADVGTIQWLDLLKANRVFTLQGNVLLA